MRSQIRRISILISISLCWMTSTCLAQNSMSQAMQDLQVLSGEQMQGREIGSPGSALARNYILKRIAELGLKPCTTAYIQEFKASRPSPSPEGKNIIACQFSDDKAAKYLVISAHYDHLGMNYNKIYFGADDNASGVAGVLAIAQNLKDKAIKHHMVYAFFDGEEQGLQGAHAFVKQSWIPRKDISANLNFDMIARGDKNELFVSGTYHNPELKTILQDLNGMQGIRVLFDHDKPDQGNDDWTPQSDHYAFFQAGIPHLYFGVEDHADYHKATDKFEKVNPQFFDGAITILQKAVQLVDQQFVRKN